jgi:AraC-like DNA-binding protein
MRGPDLHTDPLLVHLVEALIDELGDIAADQLTGRLATPRQDWSGREVIEFVRRLRGATGDELMGLGASPCRPGCSEFLIELSCQCDTLKDALTLGVHFMAIATSAVHVELIEMPNQAVIEITAQPNGRRSEQLVVDWLMILWHKRAQWLVGVEVPLDRTEFAHPLDTRYSDYATMFGGECVFNAETSRMVFPRSYLDRRIVRTPADGEHMKAWMPGFFGRPVGLTRTWKHLVKNVLRVEIANGEQPSTIPALAEEFGVGSQTLRRRLRAEGASYRTLKAEVRRELALDVLADDAATLGEASIAAGFAEPNALTRALKAAEGISSTQLREQIRRWSDR